MLSAIAIGVFILGLIAGWKLRGFRDKLPRFLGGKPKQADAKDAKPPGGNGIVDRLGRTGERIIGKGVETILGKPKGPKDDKEDE